MYLSYLFIVSFLLVVPKDTICFLESSYNDKNMENRNRDNIFERNKRQTTEFINNEKTCMNTQGREKCFGKFCFPKNYDRYCRYCV